VLVMTGANSAVGLRSMPVRYLFLDEVDGYPLDVEGEGDAISLAEARTRTLRAQDLHRLDADDLGASAIEREYEASDQRRYFVPCPHCSTGSGCASSSCAGTRAPETPPTSASPATPRLPSTTRRGCWSTASGGR
jgi:phage terminase large subunit GpA-like protein